MLLEEIFSLFFWNTSWATEHWLTLNCAISNTFWNQLTKLKHFWKFQYFLPPLWACRACKLSLGLWTKTSAIEKFFSWMPGILNSGRTKIHVSELFNSSSIGKKTTWFRNCKTESVLLNTTTSAIKNFWRSFLTGRYCGAWEEGVKQGQGKFTYHNGDVFSVSMMAWW